MHPTLVALEPLAHSAFIFNKRSKFRLQSTYRSSEMCIIDYFLIAPKSRVMLYLRRSQINVPMRPPVRETLPALNVAAEGLIEVRKEAFLRKLGPARGFLFEERLPVMAVRDSLQLAVW